MSGSDELRQLLTGLAADGPARKDRAARVRARIERERRRRTAVRATSVAAGVVVLIAGLTSGVLGSRGVGPADFLAGPDDPAPTTAPRGEPSANPSVSSSPAVGARVTSKDLLLGTPFMETTFAQSRAALVQPYRDGRAAPPIGTCLSSARGSAVRPFVGQTWSWPNEVVVQELVLEHASAADAQAALDACKAAPRRFQEGDPGMLSRRLAVGDSGFLTQHRYQLYRQLHAGARVGDLLVLVIWTQSGRVSSTAPLERALEAAVSKVERRPLLKPVPAASQQPAEEVQGYLSRGQLAASNRAEGPYVWLSDVPQRATPERAATDLECTSRPDGAVLRTQTAPVRRLWGQVRNDGSVAQVTLTVSVAADLEMAEEQFSACRADGASVEPAGLGDDAFQTEADDDGAVDLFVRVGSTYFRVAGTQTGTVETRTRARAAIDAWQRALG